MISARLLTIFILQAMVTVVILTTTPIPTPFCPTGCTCIDNNMTVDCSNRGMLQLPPLSSLVTSLDLSGNLLGPMINGSFEHLRHLRQINLSGNRLQRLQLCTFTGLLHLRSVDLHGNQLRSLPTALFADNDEMEYLDLSHNVLEELPDLLLYPLRHLKALNVSHNQATELKLGLRFQRLNQLTRLDLSHNPFRNASDDAFEMAGNWDHTVRRSVDLSYCQLESMEPSSLTNIPGLQNLSLAGNGALSFDQVVEVLKQLEASEVEHVDLSSMNITNPALFAEVTLLALKSLDLSRNKITSVPAATFGSIRSLERLDISHNLMTNLGPGFGNLVNLLELNFSHCRLESFKGDAVGQMQSLVTLDLSHNRLQQASEVDLSQLQGLQTLDLSFNRLQSTVLPGDNRHIVTLNLASNDLTSLESLPNMHSLRYFSVHDNKLQTLGAFLFTEAENITVANFSMNRLTKVDHRAFLPSSPEIIDLSHNLLTKTEYFSWKSTREVYLQNNSLHTIDQQTFYGMDHLVVLDLSANNLSDIHDQTFRFLTNLTMLCLADNVLAMADFFPVLKWLEALTVLDLGSNQIDDIEKKSFERQKHLTSLSLRKNRMRTIPVELFASLPNLQEVDISGNPFHCACDLLPLQAWLHKTKVKVKQRFDLNVTNMCVTPERHAGKLITQYRVKQFECNVKLLYMVIFGSLGAAGILLGITTSLICHYCNCHKKDKNGKDTEKAHRKHKADIDKYKHSRMKRTDLVRVYKKSEPYSKQELVNGWVASKQFVPNKHPPARASGSHKQGPPRPPWPPRDSSRSRRESREHREDPRDRQIDRRESRDRHYTLRELADRPIRAVSQMAPLLYPGQARPREAERSHQLAQSVWRDRYQEDVQPMVVRLPDRWENAEVDPRWDRRQHFPTWGQPPRGNGRESARYTTLRTPGAQRFQPYGPTYPYRHRRASNTEYHSCASPYPPQAHFGSRDHEPYYREELTAYRRARECEVYYEDPRDRQNLYGHDYCSDAQENYPRDERGQLQDGELIRGAEIHPPPRNQKYHPDMTEAKINHPNGNNTRNGSSKKSRKSPSILPDGPTNAQEKHTETGQEDREKPLRRGKSDQQLHRRDSEYRNAMENPITSRAASSPMLAEEKTSDWL